MNPNSSVLFLYIIVIMSILIHLTTFSESQDVVFIKNALFDVKNSGDRSFVVKSFSHSRLHNFTLFKVIQQSNQYSLFVVSKNDTILELDLETMRLIGKEPHKICSNSLTSDCERIVINHLSDISLLDHKALWFCFISPQNSFTSPNCLVLKNDIIDTYIQWQKKGFTSSSVQHKTHSIQTKDHIFIGSFVDNYLVIIRTKLPDVYGKIDSNKDLETPKASFYFERNSEFLTVFETEYDVYFVVVEPVSAKSQSISECLMSSRSTVIFVTRIIRICKDDPGGVLEYNHINFGTTAKADIVCPIGKGKETFYYTRAISASWSNSKLYVLFENQKNSPYGKVLCYFDVFAFNFVFDGPIRQPWIYSVEHRPSISLSNPLPNVCQKLSSGTLTSDERITATSFSVNGLYRIRNILPVKGGPMKNIELNQVQTIKTMSAGMIDSSTILVLINSQSLKIHTHSASNELCFITEYRLNEKEEVSQISGSNIDDNVFIILSTNQRVIKIKVNNCEKYLTRSECVQDAPPVCGWDQRAQICTSLNSQVDIERWERSSCKTENTDSTWSSPKLCKIAESQLMLQCVCRYCIDESKCKNKQKVQIENCTGTVELGKWSDWEDWSECSPNKNVKKRKRKCLTKINCIGNNFEEAPCDINYRTESNTGWTQWFSVSNTNLYHSFRAKCILNKSVNIPVLETQERICEGSCPEISLGMSEWSECETRNIQYRLFNCSSFYKCPLNRIQVKTCDTISAKHLPYSKEKENIYSTIHLVLAVLVASIIWVFILIILSISLLKCKRKSRKSKRSYIQPKMHRLNRELSETSNDYLSDNKSTINDIDHHDFMTYAIRDNMATGSKNIYSPFPYISDQHANPTSV